MTQQDILGKPLSSKKLKPVFIVGITMYCSQYDLTTTRVPVDILLCIFKKFRVQKLSL